MGLMTGSGCLSRVMGPVFVTYIYTEFGTTVTFSLTTVMMAVMLIWLWMYSRRLIPQEVVKEVHAEDGEELQDMNNLESVPLRDANDGDAVKV